MKIKLVNDLKTFVPAKDYQVSKQFYLDLGFALNWVNADLAELQVGEFRFLLQNYFVAEWAGNFMMQLMVEDADDWHRQAEQIGLKARYPGIMLKAPAIQTWGLRVMFLSDPSGVLWHIADRRAG